MTNKKKKAASWAEAQAKCRLSSEALQMAKELGMAPRSLIKNIPNKSQAWKAPVEEWVRALYQRRKDKAAARKARRESEAREEYSLADLGVDLEIERLTEEGQAAGDYARAETDPEEEGSEYHEEEFSADLQEWNRPSRRDIRDQDEAMQRRQHEFRQAAEYVATAFQKHPAVLRIALIGSVARPLKKEVPRFREFRRAGIAVRHEFRDVDLAVWLENLDCLNELRAALGQSLNQLFADNDIGVAHHQVDVFILEPKTHRYRGRLCHFGSCPKEGKKECDVSGCGVRPFLRQHRNFEFDRLSLMPERIAVLWDREECPTTEQEPGVSDSCPDDEIPF